MGTALNQFPACNLLLVHRDADDTTVAHRRAEIARHIQLLQDGGITVPTSVCLIPVRETESWFLLRAFEAAIFKAAGNPKGGAQLELYNANKVEQVKDAKEKLKEVLTQAAGTRKKFNLRQAREETLPALITDYTPLRDLSAFAAFESELRAALSGLPA
jgi:hypothetical protein